ncbi:LuxR C-terminal-related transcriptional regulator [Paenibacillus oceani]|uniref:AAA family ATPase n=1 Tax=Paenibacillus oceani TaxID=2772510 RepID=A0A927H2C3_9BACL|nr:AAA family ATPase [Paenibacillus oceani]MBD2866101.1 AAA family ATPase [Paenibacillus oceani]
MAEDERLDELESQMLVGRQREIAAFLQHFHDSSRSKKIVNVYGTAGIGKSTLLDEYDKLAQASGGITVTIDSEGFVKTPEAFCRHILDSLEWPGNDSSDPARLPVECISALNETASGRRVVLLIDAYEHLEALDQWLREFFLKKLDKHVLIVISGRYALSEVWYLSPAWRQLLVKLPLADLDYESVVRFAEYTHIFDQPTIQRIWRHSGGHPLTMSLLTLLLGQSPTGEAQLYADDHDTLSFIVSRWLREVPGEHMRPFIEAASVLRQFNQENLSFIMDREITASEFYQLIRFSFIRKVDRGWTVHSLMREAVNRELLARTPKRYESIRSRALAYYYQQLTESGRPSPTAREAIELMYYIGDALIRAFMNWFELSPRHFETAGANYREALELYAQDRYANAKDTRIELYDPYTDGSFHFHLTAEQTRFTIKDIDFGALFTLGYDVVRFMKDAGGAIIGVAVIIPINANTLPYLKKAPRSAAYFNHLPPDMAKRLNVPGHTRAGWFIETIDTADFADASQQTAIGHLLHSLIFTGELIVESPSPHPYFVETHKSLGFETAPYGTHRNYDGITETATFVLDLHNEQVLSYIHKMLQVTGQAGLFPPPQPPAEVALPENASRDRILERTDITAREKEVAKLLELGRTNAEIASTLYLSEVTVKKHIKSMLGKLNATNRTQLLKRLLE